VLSKFQEDPTVNEYETIVLLEQVWMYAGKREDFGRGRRENELGRKRECNTLS